MTAPVDLLVKRLRDRRGKRVVFLSHCILNENTRYLGGACRQGCVREILQQCLDKGIGIVQMPCPEQAAWGGVLKRRLLALYGAKRVPRALLPIALRYTRFVYRRLARSVAAQLEDYVASGFSVLGIVGIDGSPSCGVRKTLDLRGAMRTILRLEPNTISVEQQNSLVRSNAQSGRGIFVEELERDLKRRGLQIPLLAHDLFDELDGLSSKVGL
jgi:predicted secreted protein